MIKSSPNPSPDDGEGCYVKIGKPIIIKWSLLSTKNPSYVCKGYRHWSFDRWVHITKGKVRIRLGSAQVQREFFQPGATNMNRTIGTGSRIMVVQWGLKRWTPYYGGGLAIPLRWSVTPEENVYCRNEPRYCRTRKKRHGLRLATERCWQITNEFQSITYVVLLSDKMWRSSQEGSTHSDILTTGIAVASRRGWSGIEKLRK